MLEKYRSGVCSLTGRSETTITLTATLALMLCYLDVIDSMSLSFNPTYRIERLLLF